MQPVFPPDGLLQFHCQRASFLFVQEPANLYPLPLIGDIQPTRVPGDTGMLQIDACPATRAFPVFLWRVPSLVDADDIRGYRNNLAYLTACGNQIKGYSKYNYFKACKWQDGPETMQRRCNRNTDTTERDCHIDPYRCAPRQGLVRAYHPVTAPAR